MSVAVSSATTEKTLEVINFRRARQKTEKKKKEIEQKRSKTPFRNWKRSTNAEKERKIALEKKRSTKNTKEMALEHIAQPHTHKYTAINLF